MVKSGQREKTREDVEKEKEQKKMSVPRVFVSAAGLTGQT